MFRKLLDQGQAGDNVGLLLRGVERDVAEAGKVRSVEYVEATEPSVEVELAREE